MTIESRQNETRVEFDSIESITETKDGRMNLIYFVVNADGNGFTKRNETYECFEIADIVKAFGSIRTIVEGAAEKE